jgi:tripartite-type tricarboxylate transporter receptor subunit TctC
MRAVAFVVALSVAPAALAQDYPVKPIKLVVPFAAGGSQDTLARIVGNGLAARLGKAVVVENRPSAGGIVGADYVAKSAADGYTLLAAEVGPIAVAPSLYRGLPYDPARDFAPISLIGRIPMTLVVGPSQDARSVREVIERAKSRPGALTYASGGGSGGVGHLAMELFKSLSHTDMLHVPYKGGAPALTDVVGGRVDMMVVSISTALPHLKSGRARALATTGRERSPFLPDVPTVAESGLPDYTAEYWGGVLAPTGTPVEILARLAKEIEEALKSSEVRERLAGAGMEPVSTSREAFAQLIAADLARWAKLIREARISAD